MADDEQNQEVNYQEYSDSDIKSYIQQKEQEINSFLNQANVKAAVAAACTDPPTLWTKNAALKEQFGNSVVACLAQLKEKDFEATINSLNSDQQDVLMKFVYKGLATGENPALFKLYGALFDIAGIGCVVRAIAERRTI